MQVCGILDSSDGERFEVRARIGTVEIVIPRDTADALRLDSGRARRLARLILKAADQADTILRPDQACR